MSAFQFDPPPEQPGFAGSGAKVSQPAPSVEYVYRLSADASMLSLAALTPEEAGSLAARQLAGGATSVEIERVERSSVDDLEDAWNTRRWFKGAS